MKHGRYAKAGGQRHGPDGRFLPADTLAHPSYGPACPNCSGPKHRQSLECRACYTDRRRNGYNPPPTRAR